MKCRSTIAAVLADIYNGNTICRWQSNVNKLS
jgi:hypothetical protein